MRPPNDPSDASIFDVWSVEQHLTREAERWYPELFELRRPYGSGKSFLIHHLTGEYQLAVALANYRPHDAWSYKELGDALALAAQFWQVPTSPSEPARPVLTRLWEMAVYGSGTCAHESRLLPSKLPTTQVLGSANRSHSPWIQKAIRTYVHDRKQTQTRTGRKV